MKLEAAAALAKLSLGGPGSGRHPGGGIGSFRKHASPDAMLMHEHLLSRGFQHTSTTALGRHGHKTAEYEHPAGTKAYVRNDARYAMHHSNDGNLPMLHFKGAGVTSLSNDLDELHGHQ